MAFNKFNKKGGFKKSDEQAESPFVVLPMNEVYGNLRNLPEGKVSINVPPLLASIKAAKDKAKSVGHFSQ
jgi:hypothetical protein